MIKNDEQLEEAKKDIAKMEKLIEKLSKDILKYENENKKPVFNSIKKVKSFIMYESQKGSLFEFEGQTWEVGDFEEVVDEYGYDSVVDALNDEDDILEIEDRFAIIKLVD
jgi:hypothetical protein